MSIADARRVVYEDSTRWSETLKIDKPEEEEPLKELEWPVVGFLDIDDPKASEGANYLLRRGVTIEMANHYDFKYSPFFRRVILPIFMDGKCYGWQGRAIDDVPDDERQRNSKEIRKDQMLMFYDNLHKNNIGLMFEGPFDAIPFHSFGGVFCTLGKNVSEKQIEMINNSPIDTLYIGFDADAAEELQVITKKIEKPIKILEVPESCEIRCKENNKKADFGECTYMEIKKSFENAVDISEGYVFVHLKDFA